MASVSVSELIIFIAAISVAAAVSGVLVDTVSEISESVTQNGDQLQTNLETDTEIISDPESDAVANSTQVVVLLKNTGSTTLLAEQLDVLLNGEIVPPGELSTSVAGGGANGEWDQGRVLRVTVNRSPAPGRNRVVTFINDNTSRFEFFHK
jgi:flagellar protein FlaG